MNNRKVLWLKPKSYYKEKEGSKIAYLQKIKAHQKDMSRKLIKLCLNQWFLHDVIGKKSLTFEVNYFIILQTHK